VAHLWWLSRSAGVHDQRWTTALRDGGHRVTAVPASATVADLRRAAAEDPVDLVVAGPLTDALPLAVDAGVAPVVGVCWGFDVLLELADPAARHRVEDALARTAWVHADCRDMAGRLAALGAAPERISVSAWGIDVDFFTPGPPVPALRARSGAGDEDLLVLTTRAWEPLYGVDVLIEGFARARRTDRRLRLAWAGSGSLAGDLRARVGQLGVGDAVTEVGRLAPVELRDWLRTADLYASAARSDGTSLSLLEALACGLPAVVTDLPGNREWVTGPALGRVFPEGDADGLAAALLAAADRAPGTAEERDRRRAAVLGDGNWTANQAVLLAAVDRVLEEGGR
jgi:glycosyltransferase involved in cell wall biosynthesis